MDAYILRNLTRRDVNLGDLRIKIPAGQARNLLGKKSKITPEAIRKSEESGSISKYMAIGSLTRVYGCNDPMKPQIEMVDPNSIKFPSRVKSSIIIEVGEIDEEIKKLVMSEDEEYLKQLELESKAAEGNLDLPIVSEEE
jgi:hypothetical protein